MNTYITHHNGGRPYKVIVYDEEKKVEIYDNDDDKGLLWTYNFINIFIGHDSEGDNEWSIGNSILVEIYDCKYLFIGIEIYEFSTPEKILEYVSDIGNNDVTYPYATGGKNVYLMSNYIYFPKELCEELHDCYSFFYKKKVKECDITRYKHWHI